MMSVHDALEAWQQGEITASRAMALSGAVDVLELYGLAAACGVDINLDMADGELRVSSAVTKAVENAIAKNTSNDPIASSGTRAA
ncbi:hypothetical protein Sa4125_30030 [Aureimonas sp. SA4125]|uniref:hypothetical protein n=1 Tax=Aureimonas sp. SA4125 TaxID=2826993 RepID=UPI001CC625D0|nr:hypothetical protein [Aureimonas sp. SA4125]BDA85461.1 hypothetical protein Sa4125_30030 [Aureimonas sp. SA4125]